MADPTWFSSPVATGTDAGVLLTARVGYPGLHYNQFRDQEASLSLVHDKTVSTAQRRIEAVFNMAFLNLPTPHSRREILRWNVRVEDGQYIVAGDGLWRRDPNTMRSPQFLNLKNVEGTRDSGDPNLINIRLYLGSEIAMQTSTEETDGAFTVGGQGQIQAPLPGNSGLDGSFGISVEYQEGTTTRGRSVSVGGGDWYIPLRLRLVPPPKAVQFKMEYNTFSLTSKRMVLFKTGSAEVDKNPLTGKSYLLELDEYLGGFDSEGNGGSGVEVTIHAHASRLNRSGTSDYNINLTDERAAAIKKVVRRRLSRADVAPVSRGDHEAQMLGLPAVDDSQLHRAVYIVVKYPVRAPVVVQ